LPFPFDAAAFLLGFAFEADGLEAEAEALLPIPSRLNREADF
jgi:hypothetical protein